MKSNQIHILDGNTFVVSDPCGNIQASPHEPTGLFSYDTRFLSRWLLTIDGTPLSVLSIDDLDYFAVQFFLVPGPEVSYVDTTLSILRKRVISQGFREELTLLNHQNISIHLNIRIDAAADFADVFEVKYALEKKGQMYQRVNTKRNTLVLGYQREHYIRETLITATHNPKFDHQGLTFSAHILPHNEWKTTISVKISPAILLQNLAPALVKPSSNLLHPGLISGLNQWKKNAPRLSCAWKWLERIYQRSLIDLAALRFYPPLFPGKSLPAAGLPWFMSIFGRDSIITSIQALPFVPELAETTLLALALWQGSTLDPFRDEEPGKIMHELRYGELTTFKEYPHSPYFGSADSTPLFLILLDEYERWSGNGDLVQKLEKEAREAIDWIRLYGDRNGDGYIEYERANKETGLENQGWKDSWNAILYSDGTLSSLPRTVCEIQGYVYDAKIRCARLAREFWHDPILAQQLEQEAAILKQRFNQDFWIPERKFFALALDGEGHKVDSLTSNIGHLLWSGILDKEKAHSCVQHLLSELLFSGWGIRTMATSEGGYNPLGYHVGTVWPHDTSLICWGLWKYGYREEAARLAVGMLEAASYFKGRLPEALAGYPRTTTKYPVEYPTACSPQAWATGAPLLMIRVLLGLEPIGDRLFVDPAVPLTFGRLDIYDIPGRWGLADAFSRGKLAIPAADDLQREPLL